MEMKEKIQKEHQNIKEMVEKIIEGQKYYK